MKPCPNCGRRAHTYNRRESFPKYILVSLLCCNCHGVIRLDVVKRKVK